MSSLIKARITLLQFVLWIVATLFFVVIILADEKDTRLALAILCLIVLLSINIIHFYKINNLERLNYIQTYASPSLWISIVAQIFLSTLLIERFLLEGVRTQLTGNVAQFITSIVYLVGGVIIGFINVYVPAVYRFQILRQKVVLRDKALRTVKLRQVQILIEKALLTLDIPGKIDEVDKLSAEEIRDNLRPALEAFKRDYPIRELIEAERWLADRVREQELRERPVLFIWGATITAIVAVLFSFIANVLGVLNLLKSLVQ